jgi:hypothetical protein
MKDIIMPKNEYTELENDTEEIQGYIKLENMEMLLARSLRDNVKGDRLVESDVKYDALEKYEEREEQSNLEMLSEYEYYHQGILIENRRVNETCSMVETWDENKKDYTEKTEEVS